MFTRTGGWGRAGLLGLLAAAGLLRESRGALRFELVTGGLSKPLFVCSPPGDTNRLFIVEQSTGRIRIFNLDSKTLAATPFIIVPNLASGNERGLLGLAFHPQYRSNGYFYVNITSTTGGRTEIIRFKANGDPAAAATADRASAKPILDFAQPESNHNGGWLGFGPDGYLYISSGDGGGGNDQHGSIGNGQSRTTLLGKILRIDVDGGDPYGIPDGNPFKAHPSFAEEIWAFGLRNPWRCGFDRGTGDLWIGDVGQNTQEEVDVIPAGLGGLNFGWRPREGTIRTPGISASEQPVTPAIEPVTAYTHDSGVSITGGYVYRGNSAPGLRGKYLFADYSSRRFWTLTPDGTNRVAAVEITGEINPGRSVVVAPSSFGEDARGELYVCSLSGGQVWRIVSDGPRLSARRLDPASFALDFPAEPGVAYVLEARSPLSPAGQWTAAASIPGEPAARALSLTNAVTATEQYFRIRAE